MKHHIQPLHDRVIIKRDEPETHSRGGIALPGNTSAKPNTGVVLAIGPGSLLEDGTRAPMPVKVRDRVLFSPYAGVEQEVDGETVLIYSAMDLFAVLLSDRKSDS